MQREKTRGICLLVSYCAKHHSQQFRRLQTLVSTKWLADRVGHGKSTPDLRVLHAVMRHDDFDRGHIPGAVCFDISNCRDTDSDYPNMMPAPDKFEKYVNEHIYAGNQDHIVIYDSNPDAPSLFPGSRAWFMFKAFGHDKVSLLNGGFSRWLHEGRSIEKSSTGCTDRSCKNFKAHFRPNMVSAFEAVLKNTESKHFQLVDARAASSFSGVTQQGSGKQNHIPNAVNMPYNSFVDQETKFVLDESELKCLFASAGIDLRKPIITTCGTGITACAPYFAAYLCGKSDAKLYDGSWAEWSRRVIDGKNIKRD